MSVQRGPENQVLDQLILEVQQAPAPELDWQRAEARLMRALPPLQESAGPSFWKHLRFPAAGLLVATALAAVVVTRSPATRPVAPAARLSSVALNGDKFALGTRIAAGNQPVVIEHRGRARWELEPHSAASVTNLGEFLTLQLEVGALSASVVPSPKAETFAVEVGGTRVAVHGTAFRVEYSAERVLVSVSEGTVAVEPVGSRSAPSFLLRRDSRGSFALDGHTGTVEGNASALVNHFGAPSHREIAAPARPAAFSPHTSAPVARAAPAAASALPEARPANLPLQPAIADIETGVSSVLELMNRCFHDKTPSSGIKISVSTGLTLSVGGDGGVQSVTFTPSLAPAVEDCAVVGLRNLSFARSVDGVSFTRVFELSR